MEGTSLSPPTTSAAVQNTPLKAALVVESSETALGITWASGVRGGVNELTPLSVSRNSHSNQTLAG